VITQQQIERLRPLIDRVEEIASSRHMQARREHWQRYYQGVSGIADPEGPLYTLDLGMPTWSRILGFDMNQYMTDAFTQVRYQLKMRIFHHEYFDDDTLVSPGVGVSPLGSALEPSLLGATIEYQADTLPWVARHTPVIASVDELRGRPQPDFHTAGAMPLLHRMYDEAREMMAALTDGRWPVGFPAAIRGILGLAQTLRGPHENILLDMVDQPDFAHQLFRYCTDFRLHFARERAQFLGEALPLGHIGNDEVTVPVISPDIYREFLLPYEVELAEFHGGLSCWHSCGDTGPLTALIKRIPGIRQFYTGPWTNLDLVMHSFGVKTPLDIAIHVVDDMLAASPEQMRAKIRQVIRTCGAAPLKLRAGSTDSVYSLSRDMEQARLWTRIAREEMRNAPELALRG